MRALGVVEFQPLSEVSVAPEPVSQARGFLAAHATMIEVQFVRSLGYCHVCDTPQPFASHLLPLDHPNNLRPRKTALSHLFALSKG